MKKGKGKKGNREKGTGEPGKRERGKEEQGKEEQGKREGCNDLGAPPLRRSDLSIAYAAVEGRNSVGVTCPPVSPRRAKQIGHSLRSD